MEKKDDYKTKIILCYVGIFFCVLLIIIPPIFRIAFKKEEPKKVKIDYKQLSCQSSDMGEIIIYNYKGEQDNIGQIRYTFVMDAETFLANTLKTDLYRVTNTNKRVQEQDQADLMIYTLSPSETGSDNVIDSADLALLSSELKQDPSSQKQYYENLGFSCTISNL